jgi:putative NIF3 family GTP cyclohydrolase 1 type 2
MQLNRRQFASTAGVALFAAGSSVPQNTTLTVTLAMDRIRQNIGVTWKESTIDGVKAGDGNASVSGVAVTAVATMDTLARAVREKTNLIVSLEPVYYSHNDGPAALNPQTAGGRGGGGGRGAGGIAPDDPVFLAKKDFIAKNGLAVIRLSDHWRARTPDPFALGLAQTMTWTKYRAGSDTRYDIPGITIAALADDLANKLNVRAGIRVVGDPQAQVSRIGVLPGVSALVASVKLLPECDVIVAGETREWESVEYAQDAVAAGQKKGLIMLGRVVSEEPGMNLCAGGLKTLLPEVSVRWFPSGDSYWRPA